MFDVNKIITALQTDPNAQRTALAGGGGVAAGFAASMLMGKSGRKMMGKAAKYGAVAAIGGLAYHAWQKSQQNKQGQAAAPATQAAATGCGLHAGPGELRLSARPVRRSGGRSARQGAGARHDRGGQGGRQGRRRGERGDLRAPGRHGSER
jgi:hypothetical protein